MKKFIYILLLIALGWLIKLSYDFYQVSQQMTDIQKSLHKSEQKNASLNDQLVAVQRQTDEPKINNAINKTTSAQETVGISPSMMIKQQLELVQFALQQQQFVYALEHLTRINQSLDHYALADAVKQSLHQTIVQDIKIIQQFVIDRNVQQEQLNVLIKQTDQMLKTELSNNQLAAPQDHPQHFWEKWLSVDIVEPDSSVVANRKFILKEAELRLLLAQQLLIKGQNTEYQEMLNQIAQLLDALPDASSQTLKQQILKLKQIIQLPVPKLSSLAVLG